MASTFPELLAEVRAARGLSQEGLAKLVTQAGCKVTKEAIGHWETGRCRPRPPGFRALCSALSWNREERERASALLAGLDAQDDDAPATDDDVAA